MTSNILYDYVVFTDNLVKSSATLGVIRFAGNTYVFNTSNYPSYIYYIFNNTITSNNSNSYIPDIIYFNKHNVNCNNCTGITKYGSILITGDSSTNKLKLS